MKPLFFHVRNGLTATRRGSYIKNHLNEHTYCVQKTGDSELTIGYCVTHSKDHFSRKIGRNKAFDRLSILKGIEDNNFRDSCNYTYSPPIALTIEDVVEKAAGINNIGLPIKVKTFINNGKQKIPVIDMFD